MWRCLNCETQVEDKHTSSQFAWSFDGKNVAYTRNANMQQILLLRIRGNGWVQATSRYWFRLDEPSRIPEANIHKYGTKLNEYFLQKTIEPAKRAAILPDNSSRGSVTLRRWFYAIVHTAGYFRSRRKFEFSGIGQRKVGSDCRA
jgi:hypothetical protein